MNLVKLSAQSLAQLDAAITSIETALEDLQECGLVDGSGIDLIELSEAVAAEIEFSEAMEQAG
jgi:hypothetical protein